MKEKNMKLAMKTNMTAFVVWKGEEDSEEDSGYAHSFYCFGRSVDGKEVLLQARDCYNRRGEWGPHPIQAAGWQKIEEMAIEITRHEMFKNDEKVQVSELPVVDYISK